MGEALTDRAGEERAPPPTLLGLKDSRTAYDVTTPERVWAYWNVMLLGRGADDVLSTFAGICRKAAAGTLAGLTSRLEALGPTGRLPSECRSSHSRNCARR
jgi:arginine utilization protein RocB